MSGFIALSRDAFDHHLLQDGNRFRAWFWMVAQACWKPTKFDIQGKTVTLQRGQFCASVRQMADEWGWSKSAVDRFLTRLETETMIERKAGHSRAIITICNYAKYQSVNDDDRDSGGTATGTAAGQQRDIKEQGNKGTIKQDTPLKPPRGSRLPDDWQPVLTERSQAIVSRWPPGMFERELQKFRDHAADKGRVSKDWQAAFRKWIDNADQWKPKHPTGGNGDGAIAALDRRLEQSSFPLDRPAIGDGGSDSGGTVAYLAPMRRAAF